MTTTTTKTYNEGRVRRTLRLIKERYDQNPKAFDMGTYGDKTECGTSMCFAGWGLMDGGLTKWVEGSLELNYNGRKAAMKANPWIREFDLDDAFVEAGMTYFWFTRDQAELLFTSFSADTPEKIAKAAAVILGEPEGFFLNEVQ